MKLLSVILVAGFLFNSTSQACTLYYPHSPAQVGHVVDDKVYSTMLGSVGEVKGKEVYNNEHQLVGQVVGHKVVHADGSFAAFVAGPQILNPQSREVAVATACTAIESGAAFLLLFH